MPIAFTPIGEIRSPFRTRVDMPIQPSGAAEVSGEVVVFPEYQQGLADIEGFSHLILLYHFHQSRGYELVVEPFLDDAPHGVFATRAPRRPNALGISVVELCRRENNILHIKGIDVLDTTPLLDIKPYVPEFDCRMTTAVGWLDGKMENARTVKSDDRF